jgi:hypothetical protein
MTTRLFRTGFGLGALGLVLVSLVLASPVAGGQTREKNPTHPAQILIIRHGEKPPEDAMSTDLSDAGKERAAALHELFEKSEKRPMPFATPDFIFATKNSKKSHRPLETVTPLAKKLKLTIQSEIANEDFPKLAEELFGNPKYADKTILISWHHGTIPMLAEKLKATGFPESWKSEVFDRVWQITYDSQGKVTFLDRPQHLLPKDSEK